ncbi:MAG: GTPase, partial [Bacillota bacterium]|nr:GTPase [Bacillota bacterium]
MNTTPRGQRLQIALFGRRNVGKSSLINALANQEVAIVADVPGTTTDPVAKAMEILPLGAVMLIDTAGLDDTGELGALRIKKSLEVLRKTDLILLVVDPAQGFGKCEQDVVARAQERNIPVIGVLNKTDLYADAANSVWPATLPAPWTTVSALTRHG